MNISIKKNITSKLKILPLITMLAAGLALSPLAAQADSDDRGHRKDRSSYERGHAKNKNYYREGRRYDKHGYRERGRSHGRGHNKHYYKKGHSYYRPEHRGHRRTTYVVNDYYYPERFIDIDRLGFMIGLHTNNFDITFRD